MGKWEVQRQALQAAQQEIEGRLERTHQYGLDGAMNEELGELSINDNHPADVASELFERAKDVGLRDADKIRLQEIERALAGIELGTYGTCTNCGEAIPQERIEAFPLATLCIDCKLADERNHPSRERPVEEEFLYPGFARTDTDETSSVAFDGEDAWQAVGRYNERPSYKGDYEQIYMDDNEGIVDDMDVISNQEYRNQLPD